MILHLLQKISQILKSQKRTNSIEQPITNIGQDLGEQKETCDRSSDFLAQHDICLQKEMVRCLTPLQKVCCIKATAHSSFKDLDSFSINDLPQNYQHDEMFNLIKALADLTVMIQSPYEKIEGLFLQGTGKVDAVFINTDENRPCRCPECKGSKSPSTQWGMVRILTSSSLLSGSQDVSKYKCTLFFNNLFDDEKVIHLYGDLITSRNKTQDVCTFICITCNMQVIKQLQHCVDVFVKCWYAAFSKYYSTVKCEVDRLVVMVTHPHSCQKHISLGQWKKLSPHVEYVAATCPGSSGSYLLLPDFDVDDDDFM